jgi:hypothetical protein
VRGGFARSAMRQADSKKPGLETAGLSARSRTRACADEHTPRRRRDRVIPYGDAPMSALPRAHVVYVRPHLWWGMIRTSIRVEQRTRDDAASAQIPIACSSRSR